MSRAAIREKKLAVLRVVNENKNVLLSSSHNNAERKLEKEQAWKKVLKRAQSVGLATNDREWIYARDHIFGLWKSRTLAKRNKNRTSGRKTITFDVIDKAILEILDSYSTRKDSTTPSDTDNITLTPKTLAVEEPKCLDRNKIQVNDFAITTPKTPPLEDEDNSEQAGNHNDMNEALIKAEHGDSIEFLKMQVLKSELHRNKLQILQLERKLGLPPSAFTYDLY